MPVRVRHAKEIAGDCCWESVGGILGEVAAPVLADGVKNGANARADALLELADATGGECGRDVRAEARVLGCVHVEHAAVRACNLDWQIEQLGSEAGDELIGASAHVADVGVSHYGPVASSTA